MKQKHTTKKGPGRCHVDGTDRGSLINKNKRIEGNKLAEKARQKRLTLR